MSVGSCFWTCASVFCFSMRRNPYSVPSFGQSSPREVVNSPSDERSNTLLSLNTQGIASAQHIPVDTRGLVSHVERDRNSLTVPQTNSRSYINFHDVSVGNNYQALQRSVLGIASASSGSLGRPTRQNSSLWTRGAMASQADVDRTLSPRRNKSIESVENNYRVNGDTDTNDVSIKIPSPSTSSYINLAQLPLVRGQSPWQRWMLWLPLSVPKRWAMLLAALVFMSCLHWFSIFFVSSMADTSIVFDYSTHANWKVKSNVQYGLLIDAGSSGSRLYVYEWPDSPTSDYSSQSFLNITESKDNEGNGLVMKIGPGLSSYENDISNAFVSLVPLLDFAAKHVPKSQHSTTPLYILATAGLRLLTSEHQEQMINDITTRIPLDYSFDFKLGNMRIISGQEEAMYAWVTANTLTGNLQTHGGPRKSTIGVVDMGGASSQIAFEIPSQHSAHTNVKTSATTPKSTVMDLHFGDAHYMLYATTYLGFGANIVRDRYLEGLLEENEIAIQKAKVRTESITVYTKSTESLTHQAQSQVISANTDVSMASTIVTTSTMGDQLSPHDKDVQRSSTNLTTNRLDVNSTMPTIVANVSLDKKTVPTVNDPCLPVGLTEEMETCTLRGTGDFHSCQSALQPLLNISSKCAADLYCAFNDVNQPQIDFQRVEFLGLSEFWYTLKSIFKQADLLYNSTDFEDTSQAFCSTPWSTLQERFENGYFPPSVEINRIKIQCFKSAWVTTTFHQGHRFPKTYPLKAVSRLNGVEMQWTLGAMLLLAINNRKEHLVLGNAFQESQFDSPRVLPDNTFSIVIGAVLFLLVGVLIIRKLARRVNRTMARNRRLFYT
eukprot:CFRG2717T1